MKKMKIEGCKLSYKLNMAPPAWLLDAVGKFRNCYLHHGIHNFQVIQKHLKMPAAHDEMSSKFKKFKIL